MGTIAVLVSGVGLAVPILGSAAPTGAPSPASPPASTFVDDHRTVTKTVAAGATVVLPLSSAGGHAAAMFSLGVKAPKAAGSLRVYAYGATRPTIANIHFAKGETTRDATISRLGSQDRIAVYNRSAGSVTVDVGRIRFFRAGSASDPGSLVTVPPKRILDTTAALGGKRVAAGGDLKLKVAGAGGVPASGAGVVALSLTAGRSTDKGYVVAHAGGTARPGTSNLTFRAGAYSANLVLAEVGTDGTVVLHNGSTAAVDLFGDVLGWFAAGTATGAGTYVPVTPTRVPIYAADRKYGELRLGRAPLPLTLVESPVFTLSAKSRYSDSGNAGIEYETQDDEPETLIDPITHYVPGRYTASLGTASVYGDGSAIITYGTSTALVDVVGYFRDDPATAPGVVTGRITLPGGRPATDMTVDVYTARRGDIAGGDGYATVTDADGRYTIFGLQPREGGYFVCFEASRSIADASSTGYAAECTGDAPWTGAFTYFYRVPDDATATSVSHGAVTYGVDAQLSAGGAITGRLTDKVTGRPVRGYVEVHPTDSDDELAHTQSTLTDESGRYRVAGLNPAYDYRICFQPSPNLIHGYDRLIHRYDVCWKDAFRGTSNDVPAGTDPVEVTAGQETEGIDQTADLTASVSGTVTVAGAPAAGASVRVFNLYGELQARVQTRADGTYIVAGLFPQDDYYRVCFADVPGTAAQCWRDVAWTDPSDRTPPPAGATLVSVSGDARTTGIDAAMHP